MSKVGARRRYGAPMAHIHTAVPERHPHPVDRRARRLRLALALNLTIVVAQSVAGVLAASLGLLSDAGHNLTDVAGLALALAAVRLTRRPATDRRSFGWHRGTILAAQANAAMILALTVWITIEGVRRLVDPPDVDGPIVLVAAAVAFVVNTAAALVVHEPHPHRADGTPHPQGRDLNMQAAMLHLVSDAAASLGVLLAGLVITFRGGWHWLDPAVSLLIGASIGMHAWRLLRSSTAVLLEGTPDGIDPDDVRAAMAEVDGVLAVHDLHVWAIASHYTALSAHVVVDAEVTVRDAQRVAARVRTVLAERFGVTHSTLELEEEACAAAEHGCARAATVHPHEHPHVH